MLLWKLAKLLYSIPKCNGCFFLIRTSSFLQLMLSWRCNGCFVTVEYCHSSNWCSGFNAAVVMFQNDNKSFLVTSSATVVSYCTTRNTLISLPIATVVFFQRKTVQLGDDDALSFLQRLLKEISESLQKIESCQQKLLRCNVD